MQRYLILGAGRQGLAAAYDLVRFGSASRIHLLDQDGQTARRGAARINRLCHTNLCHAGALDVNDHAALVQALRGYDAALSAVPYLFNARISRAALKARTSLCDLGGNLKIVQAQLELDRRARAAGISIIPDCGLAPGMGNILAGWALEAYRARLARYGPPHTLRIYCGGLPQRPHPPLHYQLSFSLEGLLNEYEGHSVILRGGRLARAEALSEVESIDLPKPLGTLEAFVTSGGTSLGPWTYRGVLQGYEYKTLRFPGHAEKIRLLRDLGLFEKQSLDPTRKQASPREALKAALGPKLSFPDEPDQVILRVSCFGPPRLARPARSDHPIHPARSAHPTHPALSGRGRRPSPQRAEFRLQLHDRLDPKTGFSAMERTTGFAAAIVQIMQARGEVPPGAYAAERGVPAARFREALLQRGFGLRERALGP